MGLFRAGSKLIFFVHVPKTGGTSIETYLLARGAQQALFSPGLADRFTRCSTHHMHAKAYAKLVPRAFYDYGFMVVRNPYARVISEFCRHLRLPTRPASLNEQRFDAWLSVCLAKVRWNHFFCDNHFRRQWEFESDGVEIFKFEEGLAHPLQRASEELGLASDGSAIPHEKASVWPDVVLTRQTLDRFVAHYSDDFSRYGYDPKVLPKNLTIAATPSFYGFRKAGFAIVNGLQSKQAKSAYHRKQKSAATT